MKGPSSTRVRFVVHLLPALLVAPACLGSAAGSPLTYKDPAQQFLIEVPEGWRLYGSDDPVARQIPFTPAAADTVRVVFTNAPDPAVMSQPLSESEYPVGVVSVRPIAEEERDFVSRFMLSQTVLPYQRSPEFEELLKEDFQFSDDFEGVRVLVRYREPTTNGVATAFLQSVTNGDDTEMFAIVVGCSVECFQRHQQEITEVVMSWIVNTRA